MEKAFSIETLQKELCILGTSFYFVFMGNSLAGYFKINEGEAQSDINDHNSLELERIYVLAEFQGKGIGRKILGEVKQMAKFKKKKYVWLGVWQLNPEAVKFYKTNDFIIFGEHPYYIGNDRQMDWLMRFDIDQRNQCKT